MRDRGSAASLLPLLVLLGLLLGFVLMPRLPAPASTPHSTAVVLGAAQYAGTPSPAFARRLDHALALYRAGVVRRIVVTGGRQPGDPHTEGAVGVQYLRAAGVAASALLAETKSRTTADNLRGARALLPPGTPVTLVTDPAHMPRALGLARALGMRANASPSPLNWPPDWRYRGRERLALLASAVLGVRSR
ncbi:hypothetical protein RDMS_12675 [Deinococcus sp. RL]|uniref:YdcF family protein n=1 Tax=Deinococcus sp. RL TaxID=1489678 RepID=UPI0004D3CD32|nr:YdcF family protein [Deinococcus sp. RL]KEF33364.1 hypothetical protein RDMS_12675 [Deinococcus sp. RL]